MEYSALSMSQVSGVEITPDSEDIARIVRLVLSGETAAFEQIISRYERRVMMIAMRILGGRDDAYDAAQEVFLRVFKYLHRLDLQKPIEPWLLRLTINVCHDIGRKRQQHQTTCLDTAPPESMTASDAVDPHTGMAEEQQRQMLWKALANLAESERIAIVLRDVEGLSTSEVATILGCPEATVRSRISRGRLKLKEDVDRMMGGRP